MSNSKKSSKSKRERARDMEVREVTGSIPASERPPRTTIPGPPPDDDPEPPDPDPEPERELDSESSGDLAPGRHARVSGKPARRYEKVTKKATFKGRMRAKFQKRP